MLEVAGFLEVFVLCEATYIIHTLQYLSKIKISISISPPIVPLLSFNDL